MGLRAVNQLRQNVLELLRVRHEDQKTLAFHMGIDKSTINKFLKGTREVQLADLDSMADFFGIATYQLFQPGISRLTERRSGRDRRSARERRIGHTQRVMLAVAGEIDRVRPKRED
jgi:transcriptional regulator with XRE-family HTH domain